MLGCSNFPFSLKVLRILRSVLKKKWGGGLQKESCCWELDTEFFSVMGLFCKATGLQTLEGLQLPIV